MGRPDSETRRVQMVGVPAPAPQPQARWVSPPTNTKAETPRSMSRWVDAHSTSTAFDIETLAAAQAAIESLEDEETPKRRADTRASTEPHVQFAYGTSTNDALEPSSNVG